MSKEKRYVEHTPAWELHNGDSVTKSNYNLADIETKYMPIQTEVICDDKDKTIADLETKLAECEKLKESYRLQNEHHHLQLLQFYSRLGVEAFGADIHEKALEALMIMKDQLAEKEKEIEYQESMKILAIENKNQKAKENEILNIALDLACQTLYDINFKLYNTEMDFKEYFKQQALTHQHEDKGE